jgi:hypothetical protein
MIPKTVVRGRNKSWRLRQFWLTLGSIFVMGAEVDAHEEAKPTQSLKSRTR